MLLTLLVVTLVAAPAAAGTQTRHETVVVKITTTPDSPGSTDECPIRLGIATLTRPDGRPAGRAVLCVRDFDELANGFAEHARLTFDLAHGTVEAEVTLLYLFRADGSATHLGGGTVVGGTGRYDDAEGFFAGVGRITFDAEGNPLPNLTYVLRLR
jgi:hypothetical protein